ncbi:FAD-dependent oxidoreductase [Methyloversatilis sp.]|uniref:FAD-dependent oxidoreductase n=1 Tax=Methyloversatilis sp. TaxID=2569862 RepID=UPI003D28F967
MTFETVFKQPLDRRGFLGALGGAAAWMAAGIPKPARAAAARIVVVGGGFGGATAAKYIAQWGGAGVSVTLVEPNARHVSCILSNLVLNDRIKLAGLGFGYDKLKQRYGIEVVADRAVAADPDAGKLELASGITLDFDRLVIAPGIAFDRVPGLETLEQQILVPHAWVAGPQTQTLRDQLNAMRDGGTVVMSIPRSPYRCPPGPYERACVIADFLKRRKPRSKLVLLDANTDIQAEPLMFRQAFAQLYAGRLEYVPNAEVRRVSFEGGRKLAWVSDGLDGETAWRADVLNVIPRNTAARLAHDIGVVNVNGRWAGVDPLTYALTAAPRIHVIGDAQGTGLPKAGHIANSEAKICADAIVRLINGWPVDEPVRMQSVVANSACFSPITYDTASWLNAVFAYDAASGSMKRVDASFGEAPTRSKDNFEQMLKWAARLFDDTFA